MELIPLSKDSKKPLAGSDWHDRASGDPVVQEGWIKKGLNVGFLVEENGRVIVDFDDKEACSRFMEQYPELCTVVVETRRGFHLHFSGKAKTTKFAFGDIKGNGYCVFPPSVVEGYQYRFITNGALLSFPPQYFPVIQDVRESAGLLTRGPIANVKSYVMKIQSVQGQNGSSGLIRFIAICRDHGMSESQTLLWLLEWNKTTNVQPAWPDNDLARATTRVFSKVRR